MHNEQDSSAQGLWANLRHNFSDTFASGELLRERSVLNIGDGDDLTARAAQLRKWIQSFDPAERHSLEPLAAPHYHEAVRAQA